MDSQKISIEFPEELRLALRSTSDGFTRQVRMAAAAKLYEMGRLSSGLAAKMADVPKLEFLQKLSAYGVSVFPDGLDLEQEVAVALPFLKEP